MADLPRAALATRLIVALALLGGCSRAWAQDVPFAQGANPTSTGLSETMLSIAQRHAILWFAGNAKNWGLADYEIGQLRARFVEAASEYRNIPIEVVVPMTKALDEVQTAAQRKDKAAFARNFDMATSACNACHTAAGLGFLQVHRPAAPPLTNIEWGPPAARPRGSAAARAP